MRLLLDAHFSGRRIGDPLRAAGHDLSALNEEGELGRMRDEEVLRLAVKEDRILVTADVHHFPRILRKWAAARRSHAGVILVYGIDHEEFALIARGVERLLAERPAQEDWLNVAAALDRSTT